MRLLWFFLFLALGIAACGEEAKVTISAGDSTEEATDEDAAIADAATSSASVANDSAPVSLEDVVLEPADALIYRVAGWNAVGTQYWEPRGLTSAYCADLAIVLALEDWGIDSAFHLREGAELWQHTADLNTEENVARYVEAFERVPESCPRSEIGNATAETAELSVNGWSGFTLEVSGAPGLNWFVEPDTTSSAVILSRNNVVSILQIVDDELLEVDELAALVDLAAVELASA